MTPEIRHIDCPGAMKQLWDYLDHELTADRMAEVEHHLAVCKHCIPHHDFAQRFLEALHATREERVMPPELRSQVMRQLADSGLRLS